MVNQSPHRAARTELARRRRAGAARDGRAPAPFCKRRPGGGRTAGVAAIFREETDVKPDSVIEISDRSREVIATLQGGGFDLGVLFPNSFRSAWKLKRAGINERWGFATFPRGWLLTKRSRGERGHGIIHQSDYYRQLVRGLGVACDDSVPRMAVSGPSAARAQAILAQRQIPIDARLIGFAPGAAYGQAKQWPPERVARVAARLCATARPRV
jgi:ADP-heptose:LPS heptosyltransferase